MKRSGFGGTASGQCLQSEIARRRRNLAEIRLIPRLNSEPFQSATPSLFTH
jgi:hypothetical protein